MRGGEGRMEGWVGGTRDEDGCGGFGEAGRKKRIVKEVGRFIGLSSIEGH